MKSYKNRQLEGEELISKSFEKINQNSSEAEADLIELYQQDENLLQQIQGITATGSTNTLVDVFSVTTTGSSNEYNAAYSDFAPFAGLKVLVNFHEPNTGAATLNWNGNGAKPIKTLGREVKENEITGLALLQYSGTDWEMLDNNGIREEIRRLEATVSPKIEQLELKDVSLEQKDESLEAQIEQLRSDIQSLTQQLNNKANQWMLTAIHLPSISPSWLTGAGLIESQVIWGRTESVMQNIGGVPIYGQNGQPTQISVGTHALTYSKAEQKFYLIF